MSTTSQIVSAEEFSKFMSSLFGMKIEVTPQDEPVDESYALVATYIDDNEIPRRIISCDVACGAMLGAALTHIPKGAVQDSISAGELGTNLKDNVAEVFNISVNLFPSHQNHRLVLREVNFSSDGLLSESEESHSEHFSIDVRRYGQGNMRVTRCG